MKRKISQQLIAWYLENKRDLPWRKTNHPYSIWISEVILQQTRIAQGLPYYQRFMDAFPAVELLAEASEQEVLKLWQGLGYYSRARNLHHTAKFVASELNGKFPETFVELKKLKGIGDYTAAAIASICFDEKTAVLDGNVFRFLSRVFGIETPINTLAGKKIFSELANQLICQTDSPADFNQGIMEFGSLLCKPQQPECLLCPFQTHCAAFQTGKVEELPVKLKMKATRNRFFNYLVMFSEDKQKVTLEKRNGHDIWKHLYQFPLIETTGKPASAAQIKSHKLLKGLEVSIRFATKLPWQHQLTHQKLHINFWLVQTDLASENQISVYNIREYPVPVPIEKFINTFEF